MKQIWWKVLAVLLLLYAIIVGLTTPLKSGIIDVRPGRLEVNQHYKLNIQAYNTHFQSGGKKHVYLKIKDHLKACNLIFVESETSMSAAIDIPQFLPISEKITTASVIVNVEQDGAFVIPEKIILKQDSINEVEGKRLWSDKAQFTANKHITFPYRNILVETIRNTFFHVSLWFAMFLLLALSVYESIKVLRNGDILSDLKSESLVKTGVMFGILGLLTGSVWARFTWNTWWTTDIKLNMAALSMLIYVAYLVLRSAIPDPDRRAKISAAYNILALVAVIPMIFIFPRLTDSLHPGNGGNPALGGEDMDNTLRMVFYPAVIGFMLLGLWMASLLYRYKKLDYRQSLNL